MSCPPFKEEDMVWSHGFNSNFQLAQVPIAYPVSGLGIAAPPGASHAHAGPSRLAPQPIHTNGRPVNQTTAHVAYPQQFNRMSPLLVPDPNTTQFQLTRSQAHGVPQNHAGHTNAPVLPVLQHTTARHTPVTFSTPTHPSLAHGRPQNLAVYTAGYPGAPFSQEDPAHSAGHRSSPLTQTRSSHGRGVSQDFSVYTTEYPETAVSPEPAGQHPTYGGRGRSPSGRRVPTATPTTTASRQRKRSRSRSTDLGNPEHPKRRRRNHDPVTEGKASRGARTSAVASSPTTTSKPTAKNLTERDHLGAVHQLVCPDVPYRRVELIGKIAPYIQARNEDLKQSEDARRDQAVWLSRLWDEFQKHQGIIKQLEYTQRQQVAHISQLEQALKKRDEDVRQLTNTQGDQAARICQLERLRKRVDDLETLQREKVEQANRRVEELEKVNAALEAVNHDQIEEYLTRTEPEEYQLPFGEEGGAPSMEGLQKDDHGELVLGGPNDEREDYF
ncbi:hypothetical protein FA95DRAFT_1220280 [Auriscalpium vulgare]|uniref:Uncharacterized protein n=1 Tax=Auriscalpium vulgare TaxID=40419 RepID=A0ACB8RT99_9AGAM|nr:hypothetical protein FA95DRAFT_1220280 [Auriscalpium vulgare]